MANKKLVDYIREQIKKGFDLQTIRNHLLQYGYSAEDLDEAVRHLQSPEIRHVIHFSPAALIGITAIFVGLIATVFLFANFFPPKVPESLLDLSLEGIQTTAVAGSEITFISELDNLGAAKRYDINLKYELISLNTNEIVTFKEETMAIETRGSKQIAMQIPSGSAGGDYVLRAIATYNGQRAVATLPVKIEAQDQEMKETTQKPIKEKAEEEIAAEKPEEGLQPESIASDTVPEEQSEERETKGASALTTFEALEKAGNAAKHNRREAEKVCNELQLQISRDLCFNKIGEVLVDRTYCSKINDDRTKDVCLSNIAKIARNSDFCAGISKDSRKDSCYMNFVIDNKDFTVCDKVINQYLKQSCESLKQLSKLNVTDTAFYAALINQSLIELV